MIKSNKKTKVVFYSSKFGRPKSSEERPKSKRTIRLSFFKSAYKVDEFDNLDDSQRDTKRQKIAKTPSVPSIFPVAHLSQNLTRNRRRTPIASRDVSTERNVQVSVIRENFSSKKQSLSHLDVNKEIVRKVDDIYSTIRQERSAKQKESKLKLKVVAKKMPRTRVVNVEEVINNNQLVKKKKHKIEDFEAKDRSVVNYLRAKGYVEKEQKNRPTSRISFSCCKIDNKIFIFGGLGLSSMKDFWVYTMETGLWEKLKVETPDFIIPRYGHSMVKFRDNLVIFGGIIEDKYTYERENVGILRTVTNYYFQERSPNKKTIKWRAYHVAVAVGPHMLIHGGIDREHNKLEDMWIFNMIHYTWNRPHVVYSSKASFPTSHHAACLVVNGRQKSSDKFNIYSFVALKELHKHKNNILYEGIYFFGGTDKNGELVDKIRILKVGERVLRWIIPKTIGNGPSGRSNASIDFIEGSNIVVIHGGTREGYYNVFSNDIFSLDLEYLVWMRTPVCKNNPIERSLHCSFVEEDNLVVFGGMNENTFEPLKFFIFSFYICFLLKS